MGCCAFLAATAAAELVEGTGAVAWASQARPNVVVIETDDQTQESMRVMATVKREIGDQGVTFRNSFVNFSLCCPSRSTFLTGQYAHNHHVLGNNAPNGGFSRFEELHAHNNLAVWLRKAGYYTGLIGKYLNGYGRGIGNTAVPPGWSEWHAVVGTSSQSVYDYALDENGKLVRYGSQPQDFKQDVLTAHALDFINRRAETPNPFFLWLTYTAPHVAGPEPNPRPPSDCENTAKPAPRDAGAFASEPLPMSPDFNEADVSDKPSYIQSRPLLDADAIADITRRYRCRLESLLAVDQGVDRVVEALRKTDALGNTLLIFTSDNGFFLGEHRVENGKVFPYEPSIRVPLLMRGPGIPAGKTARDLAINADLAPTIVQATGARPELTMDGRSLLPLARRPAEEVGRALSIESNRFTAIRTERYLYARYHGREEELYDLAKDPFELQNAVDDPAYAGVRSGLAGELDGLEGCAGIACRTTPMVSLQLDYQSPAGGLCVRNPIEARIEGAQVGEVVRVQFKIDGATVARDTVAPFRQVMPAVHGPTRLVATVSMLDGRRLTIAREVRACA